MKGNRHENIVTFLGAFLQENTSALYLVMEFMDGGALVDVIESNTTIAEDQIATICREVSETRLKCALDRLMLTTITDLQGPHSSAQAQHHSPRYQVGQRAILPSR